MRAIIPINGAERLTSILLAGLGAALVIGGVWTWRSAPPRAALEVLLSRPLSGQAWLDLAVDEFRATGTLSGRGLSALARSQEVSPNEGYLMFERALIGLAAWPSLQAELKQAIAHDLAGALTYMPDPRPMQLALSVAGLSEPGRADLRARLLLEKVSDARLAGMGL